ncbi:MAG: hypothetical protein JOY71_14385 [Acetobacteraceae bacterium]|nr:hypothetical protein [Acetobacteraceae bacterium]
MKLAEADAKAEVVLRRIRMMLAPNFATWRHSPNPPGQYKLRAVYNLWVNKLGEFGSLGFGDEMRGLSNGSLHIIERRATPCLFDRARWQWPTNMVGEPGIAILRGELTCGPGGIVFGVDPERMFTLSAVERWFGSHADASDEQAIQALAADDGWHGDVVDDVWMVTEWMHEERQAA